MGNQEKNVLELQSLKEESNFDLQNIANEESAALLAIIEPLYPKMITPSLSANLSINYNLEFNVRKAIKEIKKKSKTDKLFLLINSHGGSISSSYMIARALRKSFKEIIVFIPHIAASGATLISLAGNHIVVDELISRLSPLDPQIPHDNKYISVNTILKSYYTLNEYFGQIHENHAPYPSKVLAGQMNSYLIQTCLDSLDLMTKYAKEILTCENALCEGKKSEERAEKIISTLLSFEFPMHEFVVSLDKAKNMGLSIYHKDDAKLSEIFINKNDIDIWEKMEYWFTTYQKQTHYEPFVRYLVNQVSKEEK